MSNDVELIPDDELEVAADCLRVMGHPVRLRMVNILLQGEFSVGEIADICGLRPNHACEHLRLLQGRGLFDSERRGREVYYKVADERLVSLLECVQQHCDGGVAVETE
ncbi:MAG: ArsR/SmtB family transcription factor [Candidatus Brocadiia bacterium]